MSEAQLFVVEPLARPAVAKPFGAVIRLTDPRLARNVARIVLGLGGTVHLGDDVSADGVRVVVTDDVVVTRGDRIIDEARGAGLPLVLFCAADAMPRAFEGPAPHHITLREHERIQHTAPTLRKLASGNIWGVEQYVRPGAVVSRSVVRSNADASSFLERFEKTVADLRVDRARRAEIVTSADEILSNALYDAPVLPDGSRPFALMSRRKALLLSSDEAAQVSFATDGEVIAFGCRDPFGSLSVDDVAARLAGAEKPQLPAAGEGGAGLGLQMVLRYSDHLAINLDPGRSTEVIALFDLPHEAGPRAQRSRSFNVFFAT
jgi:hypothetical protein